MHLWILCVTFKCKARWVRIFFTSWKYLLRYSSFCNAAILNKNRESNLVADINKMYCFCRRLGSLWSSNNIWKRCKEGNLGFEQGGIFILGISFRWNQLSMVSFRYPIHHHQVKSVLWQNSSQQTRDELGYSWLMVRGWARGVEEYRERKASREIQERSNLCDHGCIPITALTLDSGRWFNGGSLVLLTSPFSPHI